jgi:hypothetical protein
MPAWWLPEITSTGTAVVRIKAENSCGRITAVADVYDAAQQVIYYKAWPLEDAQKYLGSKW